MPGQLIMGIDHGTTGTKAIIFDRFGTIVSGARRELAQLYPAPGWVEHDPLEIWRITRACIDEALVRGGLSGDRISAIGLANQGETALVWDRATGEPVHNAIVWQCRRTADICRKLRDEGLEELVRARTGLTIDPYFSATKVMWLLEHIPGLRARAERGEVLFGTTDTWLIWLLTGRRFHVTDPSTASRTMLYNIHTGGWDADLLAAFGIPAAILPHVVASSGVMCATEAELTQGSAVPIAGLAVDQQASLFGHGCFTAGAAKVTYGTGCFLLMNTGHEPVASRHGLLTSVAWERGGARDYVLDGAVFNAGAAVQWLRDGLQIIADVAASEAIAASVPDSAGVYFVPAFSGLAAPYWDMDARGTFVGLTRGSTRAHLVRAALEAIAFQVRDVLDAMRLDLSEQAGGTRLDTLRVDGGATANDLLMQFQADILGLPVAVSACAETTALGAAFLAGLATGCWRDTTELAACIGPARAFTPSLPAGERDRRYAGWRKAVERSRGWAAATGRGR